MSTSIACYVVTVSYSEDVLETWTETWASTYPTLEAAKKAITEGAPKTLKEVDQRAESCCKFEAEDGSIKATASKVYVQLNIDIQATIS